MSHFTVLVTKTNKTPVDSQLERFGGDGEENDCIEWNWYLVGGRWSGYFKKKEGTNGNRGTDGAMGSHRSKDGVDVIKVKDIDWEAMEEFERKERSEYWDEEQEKLEDERFLFRGDRNAVLKMSKEEFVNQPISHATFAVLHDGKWHERGSMGWWGRVSEEVDQDEWDKKWKELVESLDPETEVTLVDCHI